MKSELIVDVRQDEIAIALTEDDRLQEVRNEKQGSDTFSVGNIYYGRVKKIMPSLNAAFIDVGYEKEAFLHFLDLGENFLTMQKFVSRVVSDHRRIPEMRKQERLPQVPKEGHIGDYLHVGDTLLVQVTKEPINTKGPRLTAEISIAGRNFVLIPFADRVMVSSKIKRESERGRLKQLVQSIKPQCFGVIVRTVAEEKRVAELDNELKVLVQRWDDCVRTLQSKQPVNLVSEELGRAIGLLRDIFSPDFENIWVNDKTTYDKIRQYLELVAPTSGNVVKLYEGEQPIFDRFDITRRMKTGLGRTVGFKDGGYLIIERTEALFSIDVNSGSKKLFDDSEENAFHYNMLAADEIVHQLRLRDIGGIIIIDFIDMDSKDNQQKLFEHVRQLMSRDRAKHNVLPLSKFCLMQITRQRVRPAVEVDVTETCPLCMGKGKVQPTILFTDRLEEQIQTMASLHGRGLKVQLHPYVYAYVKRHWLRSLACKWLLRYGIRVRENQNLGLLDTQFYSLAGKIIELPKKQEVVPESVKPDSEQVVERPTTLRDEMREVVKEPTPQLPQEQKPKEKKQQEQQPKEKKPQEQKSKEKKPQEQQPKETKSKENKTTEQKQPKEHQTKPKAKTKPETKAEIQPETKPDEKAEPEQKSKQRTRSKARPKPAPKVQEPNTTQDAEK